MINLANRVEQAGNKAHSHQLSHLKSTPIRLKWLNTIEWGAPKTALLTLLPKFIFMVLREKFKHKSLIMKFPLGAHLLM